MGRASRKRAEQRQQPAERSAGAALERPVVGPLDRERGGSPSRPPLRHPPLGAHARLQHLSRLRAARTDVDTAIAREVHELLALGEDWGNVGRALGVSRQAARQRYGLTRG